MSTTETYEWTETPPLPFACPLGAEENSDTVWKPMLQLTKEELPIAARHAKYEHAKAFRAYAEWVGPHMAENETLEACIRRMNAQAEGRRASCVLGKRNPQPMTRTRIV